MVTKEKWVKSDNLKHFFKKNKETSTWDKYEGDGNIVDRYKLKTYVPNGLIIYNENSGRYVELSDGLAKFSRNNVEDLDATNSSEKPVKGFWVETGN